MAFSALGSLGENTSSGVAARSALPAGEVSGEVSDGAEESQWEVGKPEVGLLGGQEMAVRGGMLWVEFQRQ